MNVSLKGVWPLALAIAAVAIGSAVMRMAFVRTSNGGWMWLSILTDGAFALLVLGGIVACASRFRSNRSNVLALACVVLAAVAVRVTADDAGLFLRDRDFERLRPAMEQAVERLRALPDSQLRSLDPATVVPEYPDRFYAVRAFRPTPDRFSAWFFYGGLALPPRHAAWLYDSDSTATGATVHGDFWHRGRKLRPHWFDASD